MTICRVCFVAIVFAGAFVAHATNVPNTVRELRTSYSLPASGSKFEFSWEAGRAESVLTRYHVTGAEVIFRRKLSAADTESILRLALAELTDFEARSEGVVSTGPNPTLSALIGTRRVSMEYLSHSRPKDCGRRMAEIWEIIERYAQRRYSNSPAVGS